MHMISKKDLSKAEMDTLTKSCSPTIVITCRGNRPCTSYSRTNNYVQMATTLRIPSRITTSRLSTMR